MPCLTPAAQQKIKTFPITPFEDPFLDILVFLVYLCVNVFLPESCQTECHCIFFISHLSIQRTFYFIAICINSAKVIMTCTCSVVVWQVTNFETFFFRGRCLAIEFSPAIVIYMGIIFIFVLVNFILTGYKDPGTYPKSKLV